jgi:hypothetical protein
MPHRDPDTFSTVCVIAEAANITAARAGSCRFIQSECSRTTDTPEMMLPTPLSPSGEAPATHFLCTRRMTSAEFQRQDEAIRTYPVLVTAHVVESEAAFLAVQGLKRIAS